MVPRREGTRISMHWKGVVASRSEASSRLVSPGDAVLVERGTPRWLILACPCRCGEELPVNLDGRVGKAWRVYRDRCDRISLFPSVWRDSGCEAHFILWRNTIWLLGTVDGFDGEFDDDVDDLLKKAVLDELLAKTVLEAFTEIAERVDANPWDVLKACRQLVGLGLLEEGANKERGSFRRPA